MYSEMIHIITSYSEIELWSNLTWSLINGLLESSILCKSPDTERKVDSKIPIGCYELIFWGLRFAFLNSKFSIKFYKTSPRPDASELKNFASLRKTTDSSLK